MDTVILNAGQKALNINPAMIEGHNNLGIAKKDIGELSQSLDCFQKALKIDPKNMEAQRNKLMNLKYSSMGQKTLYEKHLQHVHVFGPGTH